MKKIRSFFSITMSLALTLVLVVGDRQPVQAAAIIVDTAADELNSDGDCSLREAIQAANTNVAVDACPAGSGTATDMITFAATTNGIPIVLIGPAAEDANTSGDLDILAGGDLTIQGNGITNTIIDGDSIDRVFHICPGGGCDDLVNLSGVTIRNGTVTLSGGGGLRNEGGTTTLDASALLSNIAVNGGGIANFATLNIQNGTKIGEPGAGNWAYAGNGGGIYNYAGSTTIDASSVISNTAANNGGGIWSQTTLNVQNASLVSGNTAEGLDAEDGGGGIYNYAGTTTVDSGGVDSNRANRGGGIYNCIDGSTTVSGSIVGANTATTSGGGVFNDDGMMTVEDSTVNDNMADFGGGIYNEGITTLDGSSVISNITNQYGGGIFNNDTLNIQNDSLVNANKANSGGGIYNQAILNINNGSFISDNEATGTEWEQGGGGIYNGDTMTINDSIVSGNKTNSYGGGIYHWAASTTMDNCTVSDNKASGDGGGIYALDGNLSLDESVIIANTATEDGGGILNDYGATTLNGGMFIDNTAADGGGIYNRNGTTMVTGSRFLYNTATNTGGGVYNDENTAEATGVTGSCIVGNSDIALFNNQPSEQVATGNWWGAATGPNTSGADTVLGNVDVSDYLAEPILDCTPDLQVGKINDTGGQGVVGNPFHWILTIRNAGLLDASFVAEQAILVDNLPPGPSYGIPMVSNIVDITNSANLSCNIAQNTLTCESLAGGVIIGAVTGSFEVSFSTTSDTQGTLVNPTGICRVDPDDHVDESDEDNSCPADFVEINAQTIYLPLVRK